MTSPTQQDKAINPIAAFHEDEGGIETLQVVMIVGVAVVILLVIVVFWDQVKGWAQGIFGQWEQKKPKAD